MDEPSGVTIVSLQVSTTRAHRKANLHIISHSLCDPFLPSSRNLLDNVFAALNSTNQSNKGDGLRSPRLHHNRENVDALETQLPRLSSDIECGALSSATHFNSYDLPRKILKSNDHEPEP